MINNNQPVTAFYEKLAGFIYYETYSDYVQKFSTRCINQLAKLEKEKDKDPEFNRK